MSAPDLNLLVALDVLLAEGSVARASRRLGLSPSAMSRTLSRLRAATGDPLLVRAGRGLVPTPRALELRTRVGTIVDDAKAALRPAAAFDVRGLKQSFTIRASDGFVENFGPALLARVLGEAPGVQLNFIAKLSKDSDFLRDGRVDLETGVIGPAVGPEIRAQALFRDRFVGVVRKGHPLARGRMTAQRYAAAAHVLVARRGLETGAVDRALAQAGLARHGAVSVGGFATAIRLAAESDLVATVAEKHTRSLWRGMQRFALPLALPPFTVSLFWHPRLEADPAHRWLRSLLRAVCR